MLVQTTCVPFLIVKVAGSNMYLSFFSTIFTIAVTGVAVGVGLGCAVAVGAGVALVPPQATSRRVATVANDKATQRNRTRTVNCDRAFLIRYISSPFYEIALAPTY